MDRHVDLELKPANTDSQLSIKIFLLHSAKTKSSLEWPVREDLSKLCHACACTNLSEYAVRIFQSLLSLALRALSVFRPEGPVYCLLPLKTASNLRSQRFSNASVNHYGLNPDTPLLDSVRNWSLSNSKSLAQLIDDREIRNRRLLGPKSFSKPRKEESEFVNPKSRKYRKLNPKLPNYK